MRPELLPERKSQLTVPEAAPESQCIPANEVLLKKKKSLPFLVGENSVSTGLYVLLVGVSAPSIFISNQKFLFRQRSPQTISTRV